MRLEELFAAHEDLKRRIHAFRVPIHSPTGRAAVGALYFATPCVAGWYIMQWSNGRRDANLGRDRAKLLAAIKAREEAEGGPAGVAGGAGGGGAGSRKELLAPNKVVAAAVAAAGPAREL